jgi:hypothetical protein
MSVRWWRNVTVRELTIITIVIGLVALAKLLRRMNDRP